MIKNNLIHTPSFREFFCPIEFGLYFFRQIIHTIHKYFNCCRWSFVMILGMEMYLCDHEKGIQNLNTSTPSLIDSLHFHDLLLFLMIVYKFISTNRKLYWILFASFLTLTLDDIL